MGFEEVKDVNNHWICRPINLTVLAGGNTRRMQSGVWGAMLQTWISWV
jgi:hypothetical protein